MTQTTEITTLTELLAARGSECTPKDLEMDGDEIIFIPALVDPRNEDLTVWAWESDNSKGFLRDDSGGFCAIDVYTRDGQLRLAAWNVDFDIRLLESFLDDNEMDLILDDAHKYRWGFDMYRNKWDDN